MLDERAQSPRRLLGKPLNQIMVCILDRPRHAKFIGALRKMGVRIKLIQDCDISGAIATCLDASGVDLLYGIGGAPEGVLAAAALRCIGGQMQGRLVTVSAEQKERARKMGITDFNKKFTLSDLASGDVMFAATGVTDGSLLRGVRFEREHITTETVVMRSATGTVRWIKNRRRADAGE